ncbi:hypothetical protein C2E31_01580 [Rhodopirellula baltica]|nr:hypothetical protein C2E31_01580 [Rhodopirellula baltica]
MVEMQTIFVELHKLMRNEFRFHRWGLYWVCLFNTHWHQDRDDNQFQFHFHHGEDGQPATITVTRGRNAVLMLSQRTESKNWKMKEFWFRGELSTTGWHLHFEKSKWDPLSVDDQVLMELSNSNHTHLFDINDLVKL